MKKILTLVLSFYCILPIISQDKVEKALFKQLDTAKTFSVKKELLNSFATHYNAKGKSEKGLSFFDSLIPITKDKNLIAWQYLLKGVIYSHLNKIDEDEKVLNIGLKYAKEGGDKKILSAIYMNLATLYTRRQDDTDLMLETYGKAVKLQEEAKDYDGLCRTYINLAGYYLTNNQFFEAEQHIQKMILYNKKGSKRYHFYNGFIHYLLGATNTALGNTSIAENHYNEAIVHFNNAENYYYQYAVLVNAAENFLRTKELSKAKKTFEDAIILFENNPFYTDWEWKVVQAKYIMLLLEINDPKAALKQYDIWKNKKGLKNIKTIKNHNHTIISMEALIDTLKGNYDHAIKQFEGLEKSNKLIADVQLSNYAAMENIYIKRKQWKKAFNIRQLFNKVKDSIKTKETQYKIAYNSQKLGLDKKEKENLVLKQQQSEQRFLLEKQRKQRSILLLSLLAALISLGIFAYFFQKNQQQKRKIINLQKELHHRVKNNLAIIDTFLEVAKDDFPQEEFETRLTEIQLRVNSINQIHQQLYISDRSNVEIKVYVDQLVNTVSNTFQRPEIEINRKIKDSIKVQADVSLSLGLIINEFLTNSMKYAFPNGSKGMVNIEMKEHKNTIELNLSDSGQGLPKEFDIETTTSFGIRIIKLLTEQIKGTFQLESTNGVSYQISFPK